MKNLHLHLRHLKTLALLVCALSLFCLPRAGRADNLTTTICQGGGATWNAAIWQTNGSGTAVAPVAGNTYEEVYNGIAIGNNKNTTRVRTPMSGVQTFPGDSLTLDTNTELRLKNSGTIFNFPEVNGNPGLILNGGVINIADIGNWPITGTINVAAQSYLCPGNNTGGGSQVNRSIDIQGPLTGSGTLVLFEGRTDVPQRISGNANTFSGQWIVKAGWLWGAGTHSLGTNSITIDPGFVLPEPPLDSSIVEVTGPALLQVSYDLNSAGTLTLINGGQFTNQQNCCFTAVIIEGTPLTPGTHYYADLAALYPNFPAGGSGSITVQPYGTPPVLAPMILTQPVPQMLYAGRTAAFTVAASGHPPLTYQWRKNGANLTDGGNVSGSTNATLTLANVSAADSTNYDVVVTGSGGSGSINSSVASLTVLSPSEPYASAVLAANPVAFYEFNDIGDPATNAYACDSVGGFVGTYGTGVLNGNPAYNIMGPMSADGFPGFAVNNTAAEFFNGVGTSRVAVPPWNLNTNTVTITAWIYPWGAEGSLYGLVFCHVNAPSSGFGYSGSKDPVTGNYTLGYTWNGEWETWNWNSGLVAPPGQWSFVALVVTPTNATIHVMNTSGLLSATHVYSHVVQAFGETTLIGDDGVAPARVFDGIIDDVAVFTSALSKSQLLALFSAADGGLVNFAPLVSSPTNLVLIAGQTAEFDVVAGGSDPLSFQWQAGATGSGVFTNLTDAGNISGSATAQLTITNITAANAGDYHVVVSNAFGSVTSSVATLTLVLPQNFTTTTCEGQGANWNDAIWQANGSGVAVAPVAGNTYEEVYNGIAVGNDLNNTRVRNPTVSGVQTFPGDSLTLDTNTELRLKLNGTILNFPGVNGNPGLILNGGVINIADLGTFPITGTINVAAQSYLCPGNADGGGTQVNRSIDIQGQLTGSGTLVLFEGMTDVPQRISGNANTFSGQWIVKAGWLWGAGTHSLGTNSITIDPGFVLPEPPLDSSIIEVTGPAWLEVSYDINSAGTLTLTNGGQFNLHQNCCFTAVIVEGTPLTAGTHYYADLAALYPNFPAGGSGSITVQPYAYVPPPVMLQVQFSSGTNLQLRWSQGILLQADAVTGPWTTNNATSPFTVTPTAPQKFYRVLVQ